MCPVVSFRVKPTLASTPPTTRRTTPSITAPSTSILVGEDACRVTPERRISGSSRVCIFASGFHSHQAVARTAGNILIRLADSLVLPLNCSDYAESLEDYLKTAVDLYEPKLPTWNISMGNHETRGVVETTVRREKQNGCSRSSFFRTTQKGGGQLP